MHTIEHLFATYARSTRESKHVIYVGPMGCRTGFYFITRGISHMQAIELVRESLTFVRDYEGEIPGATEVECGNYREHDLTAAKEDVVSIVNILQNYTPEQLVYKV